MRKKRKSAAPAPSGKNGANTRSEGINKTGYIKTRTCVFNPNTGEIAANTPLIRFYAVMPPYEIGLIAATFTSQWGVTEMAEVDNVEAYAFANAPLQCKPYRSFLPPDWEERFDNAPYEVKQAWAELKYYIDKSILQCLN